MIDLGATFLSSVDRCPEAIAITYQNKHLNYSNWLNKISSLAISLKKMGLRKGDRLMTLLPNTFEACTIHWACQLIGIVIVPINWRVKSEEIIFFLKNSKSKCIIFDDFSEPMKSSTLVVPTGVFLANPDTAQMSQSTYASQNSYSEPSASGRFTNRFP